MSDYMGGDFCDTHQQGTFREDGRCEFCVQFDAKDATIARLSGVIEEARAIAWDLYENPWDIPDAARDEISDLHSLLARAVQS